MNQIFAKTVSGKTITLDVEPSDSIESVKIKIQDKDKLPSNKQRLMYGGRQLGDDSCTLSDCNVKMGSTLYVHLSLHEDFEKPVAK
ncbi:Hypothetical protein CINCED_3A008917 [Cinara cedri]|nr:Hypothetical protein CINCED_3A008917 [Cinara cedri]